MVDKREVSGVRTCPSCGAVLETAAADQFFCEYCGSHLGDGQSRSVLPDWLQDVSATDEVDGLSWLDRGAGAAKEDSFRRPDRIELRPTGAAISRQRADRQHAGVNCSLVLGITLFLIALCLLGWVVFLIVR